MLKHKGTNIIETERLILRPYRSSDAEFMFRNWANDREVTRYLTWNAHRSVSDSENIINSWINEYSDPSRYNWAIVLRETGEPVGGIDVCHIYQNTDIAEIGYCLGRNWWNKGFMTESLKAVIPYLFDVGFEQVLAVHAAENTASGRVMQKCGMKYEGTLRRFFRSNDGRLLDLCYYSILREEFLSALEFGGEV